MIKFKNYCNQLPSLFRTYVDFESNLEDVEIWEGNYSIIEIWEGNHSQTHRLRFCLQSCLY